MAIIVKTDKNNYFVNTDGSISMKYDPYVNEYFKYGNEKIESKYIYLQEGGQIVFKVNDEKIIIDDGYRTVLVAAGYLTGDDLSDIKTYSADKAGYRFLIEIEPLNKIITRNLTRKSKQLPLYPTERGFEKSSFYFRVYATKDDSVGNITKPKTQLREIGFRLLQDLVALKQVEISEMAITKVILKYEDDM